MDKRLKTSELEAFRLIEEMLQLMESRGLVELEMEHQGLRIRLKKATIPANQSEQVKRFFARIKAAEQSPEVLVRK